MDIDIDISGYDEYAITVDESSLSEMRLTIEIANRSGSFGAVRLTINWDQLNGLYDHLKGWFEPPPENVPPSVPMRRRANRRRQTP